MTVAKLCVLAFVCAALSLAPACTSDPPPTYLPSSGAWSYVAGSVNTNTCSTEISAELAMGQPLMGLFIDYDAGEVFSIELGAEDVVCEIDAERFSCSKLELFNDGTLSISVSWEGELSSSTQMSGVQLQSVSCLAEDGDCAPLEMLPCTREVLFDAEFIE